MTAFRQVRRVVIAGVFLSAHLVRAQDTAAVPPSPSLVRVRGLAFDGLRGAPLRSALITLADVGESRTTTTDSRGRFQFDSVPPGLHTFAMQHATLDSLGFSGLSTRATITTGREEVRIGVPPFSTLWHAECGSGRPPKDSGFVYGTVLDADGRRPVAGAVVRVAWSELVLDNRRKVNERRWRVETRADSAGNYAACGVALDEWLTVQASADSAESGLVDLRPDDLRVRRRDLLVGPAATAGIDSTHEGTVIGIVTDASGAPFAEARVVAAGGPEVRSGADGRFTLRNVPSGTRQLHVWSIGIVPVTTVVDVMARDTTIALVQLRHAVSLDGMRIVAARAGHVLATEFTARQRSGVGYFSDSAAIARYPTVADALDRFPSLRVDHPGAGLKITMPGERGESCTPELRIDGAEAGLGHLLDLYNAEVAAIEMYPRAMFVPPQFVRAGHPPVCGMILAWTKYAFSNR